VVVEIGDQTPDLELTRTDGSPVHLSAFRGETMALIFMRHLG
jgi:peroxiredoxin